MRKRLDEIYTVIFHSLGLFDNWFYGFIYFLINLQLFLYSKCQILMLQAARIGLGVTLISRIFLYILLFSIV